MNQFLLALQEKTKNEFPLYQAKFTQMCNDGRNQEEVYNILFSFFSIRSYCPNFDFKNADYFDFMYAINKGSFLSQKFNDKNNINIMQKCLVYQDDQCIIFKPTNFEESKVLGEPICCFSNNKNYWQQHYDLENEAIYFVFEVMQIEPNDFVAITVKPNGRALVLNSAHEWSNKLDSIRFIQALGKGACVIVSKTGNPIKLTENYNQKYCNKNMNRNSKNVVRLTESELRNVIKESVKRVLKEGDNKYGRDAWWQNFKLEGKWDELYTILSDLFRQAPSSVINAYPDELYEAGDHLLRLLMSTIKVNWTDADLY